MTTPPAAALMDRDQAEQLAAFVTSVRDDWSAAELVETIGRVHEQLPVWLLAMTVLRVAANPDNTPAELAALLRTEVRQHAEAYDPTRNNVKRTVVPQVRARLAMLRQQWAAEAEQQTVRDAVVPGEVLGNVATPPAAPQPPQDASTAPAPPPLPPARRAGPAEARTAPPA